MSYYERIVPGEAESRVDLAAHYQRYEFAAQFVLGKRVLDAGCGVGYGSRLLAEAGAGEVVGVDISKQALEIACKRFGHPVARYLHDDLEVLQSPAGPFDVIVAFECFEHLREPNRFLARTVALLDAEGVFLCSTPQGPGSKFRRPANPHHVAEYSAQEFEEILLQHFRLVRMLGQQWSAAFRMANALWSNPFVRLGRWIQNLRGHKAQVFLPTGSDVTISEANYDLAWTLVAICRNPRTS